MRRLAGPGTIACAVRTFVVRIGVYRNVATTSIDSAAFFGCRTGLTRTHANVAATKAIDAIPRQTLRGRRARGAIVILAHVFAVARTARAIIVRIRVVFDRPANPIDTAAFFGGAARHAFVVAFGIAAKTIDAITRRALRSQRARRGIRWRSNRALRRRWRSKTSVIDCFRFTRVDYVVAPAACLVRCSSSAPNAFGRLGATSHQDQRNSPHQNDSGGIEDTPPFAVPIRFHAKNSF